MEPLHTTHKPWETKTIEHFTEAELVHWVDWYVRGRTGSVVFNADQIVHNILLWERTKKVKQGD